MKKLMNGAQMKMIDVYSIQEVGIPSLVLMERAALCVTEAVLEKIKKTDKVLCVCGSGNNGADGMAVARQLTERGISAEVYTTAEEGKGTEELNRQRAILQKLGIVFVNDIPAGEYNCIIDAVFGIGLSRTITGRYEQIIEKINAAKDTGSLIVAVDTPSGINAGDGHGLCRKGRHDGDFRLCKMRAVPVSGKNIRRRTVCCQCRFCRRPHNSRNLGAGGIYNGRYRHCGFF